jgi:glyoxylase-like metal-dependent hydrolase (beta-lactamase superfamily II)
MAATAARLSLVPREGRGAACGRCPAAAICSARARDIPQWHDSARCGTRRPQDGHCQVWGEVGEATITLILRPRGASQGDPAHGAGERRPDPGQNAWMPETSDLGHGIHSIDTGFVRPFFDASHLVIERGRAAFVDVGTNFSIPTLLEALEGLGVERDAVDYVIVTHVHLDHAGGAGEIMKQLPRAKLVVHPRGARHMIDPAMLWAGALAVYGEETMRRHYGSLVPVDPARVVEAPDGFTLELAGRPLVFLDTPGHARHHFCVWDEASRSMFSGDTFGLAYRELASPRGSFIMPTTTPVQFEPAELVGSIDRLVGHAPRAMLLTHYSRVTEVERLAGELKQRVRAFAALGRDAPEGPARSDYLKRGVRELVLGWVADHGTPLARPDVEALLAVDIELNAMGIESWLDRDIRE